MLLKEVIIFWGKEEAYIKFPIIAINSSLDSQMTFFPFDQKNSKSSETLN